MANCSIKKKSRKDKWIIFLHHCKKTKHEENFEK